MSILTVTGGTGYVASWIVKDLLEQGHTVKITVRDKTKEDKYSHLTEISKKAPGKLEIFEADLLVPNSFDNAVNGSQYVIHTASPFFLDDKGDTKAKLINPAVKGTENILASVNKYTSVEKVVLTSSIAAIMSDNIDHHILGKDKIDESMWNKNSTLKHNAYNLSKTLAEQKAWEIAEAQNRWKLVTINPGFVIGPSLTKRVDSTSINTVLRIVRGEFAIGSPDLDFLFSDVRDISKGHILAAFSEKANGRYIIANQRATIVELSKYIEDEFPNKFKLPTRVLPKPFIWLIAPLIGLTRKFVTKNIGYKVDGDNSKSIKELNIEYFKLSDTICDHVKQLLKDELI